MPEAPVVLVRWEAFVGWLLDHTERFPRRIRFTLTNRIDNLALDAYERLAQARYARDKAARLGRVNQDLERLRLLLRLAHQRRALPHRAYVRAASEIDVCGRMVGGWLRHLRGRR